MKNKRFSWAACVLNPSIECLNLIFWTEQPIVVGHMPQGDESLWLQMEIIDTIPALCWFMVQWGLTCPCGLKKPFVVLITCDFSFASSFPFLVNPSHTDKVNFLQHILYCFIPCSEPFQASPLVSDESTLHSIAGKALHNQNSICLFDTISLPLLFSVHSCPFFKHIFKCSSNSYSWNQQYSFTSLFNIKPYFFSFVLM